MNTTATRQRFALDETRARDWLRRVIAFTEWELNGEGEEPRQPIGQEIPAIGEAWDPRAAGEENNVWTLVREAVDAGIITAPEGLDLDFEYVADDDGGYYHYLIRINYRLKLASCSEEMRKLGIRDTEGLAAAMAILREATGYANDTLEALGEFIAARAGDPDCE